MSVLTKISNVIDTTIGVLNPRAEVARRLARNQVRNIRKRQYAAAKTTRLTGDWSPVNTDVNSLIRTSSATIRARTRQLVRDFPYFARAVNVLTDYVVGEGIQFQSRVRDTDGKLDKKTAQKIEDALAFWMDEADIAGKLHYHELERLAKRQDVESGEYLFITKNLPDRKRYTPLALQPVETDWLTTLYTQAAANTLVDQGVEYDTETGRPVAYHFTIPDGFNPQLTGTTKTVRVAAEHVIHGFETLRPGQLRGISPFTTAILIAHDLDDYINAEIDGAKLAAKYLAFIKTPDPAIFQASRAQAGTGVDEGKKIEEIENAILEYLRPGEEITLADHNRPGDAFTPFTQFVLRMLAVSTGISYELLSGDYKGINYSNLRGIRNDFAKQLRPLTQRHINHFSRPVIRTAIESAVIAGKLDLRNFWRDPHHYFRGTFIAPGMESIDPLREGKAWVEQIKAGLRSPQEIVGARGRDYEEVINEIAEAKKLAESLGIEWMPKTSGGLQQNPAKVGASESGK